MGVVTGGGGGGGSMPVYESGYYEQNVATPITNGNAAYLPFDLNAGGDAMLNISTPAHPLVLKAGLFVVTAEVSPTTPLTTGGAFWLALTLDWTGEAIEMKNGAVAANGFEISLVSNSWVMAAGEQFRLLCQNFDGVATRSFKITNATVSRVGPA